MHCVLDVTMRKDASNIRECSAPEKLSLLKKMILNNLRTHTSWRKKTAFASEKASFMDDDLRAQLLVLLL